MSRRPPSPVPVAGTAGPAAPAAAARPALRRRAAGRTGRRRRHGQLAARPDRRDPAPARPRRQPARRQQPPRPGPPGPRPAPGRAAATAPTAEATRAAHRFVGTCLEIINGYRPAAQIRPLLDPARPTTRLVTASSTPRVRPAPARRAAGPPAARLVRLRRLRVCEPRAGAVRPPRCSPARAAGAGRWRSAWSGRRGAGSAPSCTCSDRPATGTGPARARPRPRRGEQRRWSSGPGRSDSLPGPRRSQLAVSRCRRARRGSACTSGPSRRGRARCGTGRCRHRLAGRRRAGRGRRAAQPEAGRCGRTVAAAEPPGRPAHAPAPAARPAPPRPRRGPASPSMVGAEYCRPCGCGGAVQALGPDLHRLARAAATLRLGRRARGSLGTWTSRLNRKPTVSSLMPSIMVANMSKPSRWYSTTGSRWAYARRLMPSWR